MIKAQPTGPGQGFGGEVGYQPMPVLKAPGAPQAPKSPLGGLTGGTNVNSKSTWQEPNYISVNSTQSAVNNRMGQAHMMGDPRIFQKQMARNGVSSSKGTDYFAQVGQQQALSAGRADSAGIQAQDQMNNSKARLDFQYGREQEAQQMGLIQHLIDQANWGQGFADQQAAATVNAAQQRAQLDLYRRLLG